MVLSCTSSRRASLEDDAPVTKCYSLAERERGCISELARRQIIFLTMMASPTLKNLPRDICLFLLPLTVQCIFASYFLSFLFNVTPRLATFPLRPKENFFFEKGKISISSVSYVFQSSRPSLQAQINVNRIRGEPVSLGLRWN